ncbi:MAG: MFS transporter [Nitrososphaerota archaeon]|nr:MFS transporter [Nitrososphaerota archaeon]
MAAPQMDRNVRLLGVAMGLRLFGAAMVYPFLSLFFYHVAGLPYWLIGALILLVSVLPLAVSPFGGLFTDRHGRKRVFIAGLSGETASVFCLALSMRADFVPGVLLFGALTGVAGSIAQPAIQAYVADMTDVTHRAMAYTWVRIGFNGGYTAGVVVGAVLVAFIGYADTALVTTALLASGVVFMLALLAPSPYDAALKKGEAHIESAAKPRPMRDSMKALGKDRTFLMLSLASLFAGLVYGHWGTTFVLFSNTVLHVSVAVLGPFLAINGLIVIFGQVPMTKMMTGRKHTFSAMLAAAMMIVAFLALGAISLFAGLALLGVLAFVVLLTVGENLGAIPSMTLPSNVAPQAEIGNYNGVFGLFSGVGNSMAPAFGGIVLGAVANPLLVWAILALPGIPAIILFRRVGTRIPEKANTI